MAFSSCGGTGATTVHSVTVTPAAATVAPNSQAYFTAVVNLTNGNTSTSTAVSWEVNGVVGGNSTTGTIVSSSTDNQLGVYTAPTTVPSTNNGKVDINAVAQQTNNSSSTVSSNTAIVTVTVTLGFSISPVVSTVPAGGTAQFSAILNGATDVNAKWSVASADGGDAGSIDAHSGLYTAPLSPPPGNSITITGQDGSNSASDTVSIVWSDHSLSGPYSFAYTGDNPLGFYAVVGSFITDGNGTVLSGSEDIDSFLTGVTTRVPISGNYVVGSDGRASATLSDGSTWRFLLVSSQHGTILRTDGSNTGGGTIDQQDVNALSGSNGVISGPYVFAGLGADSKFNPMGTAGKFVADGSGTIPAANAIVDVNDGGSLTKSDTSLNGSYSFDTSAPGTGRGVLNLTSTSTGPRQYAFYVVDNTHWHFVEIDHSSYFSGEAFSGLSGNSFSAKSLASANYAFTAGGSSPAGAYTTGGIFASDGAGNLSGGTLDINDGGSAQTNISLSSCTYSIDPATGRIDLRLCGANGSEFAFYQTARGSAVLLEMDTTAISIGTAFQQQASSLDLDGSFALRLTGQGIFHDAPGSYQPDSEAQVTVSGGGVTGGHIDLRNYNGTYLSNAISTSSSIASANSNGRGTLVIEGKSPVVTYDLLYYVLDSNTALLLDEVTGFILTGVVAKQF